MTEGAPDYVLEDMAERHRGEVLDIFNHFVATGFAAYPDRPAGREFFDRLRDMAGDYPSVVVLDPARRVVGFALMRPHYPWETFRRTAVVSWFILPEHTGRGVGTAILEAFVAEARRRGITSLLASVSSLNPESLGFHARRGFREVGRFRSVGRKRGRDFDEVWLQLEL